MYKCFWQRNLWSLSWKMPDKTKSRQTVYLEVFHPGLHTTWLPEIITNTSNLLSVWLKMGPFNQMEQIWLQKCKKYMRRKKKQTKQNMPLFTRQPCIWDKMTSLRDSKDQHWWPVRKKKRLLTESCKNLTTGQVRSQGVRRRCPLWALMVCYRQASWQGTATLPVKEQKDGN